MLLADPDRPADERLRLGLDVVRDLTARAPSVVVFDDLHWADSESVALFERLAEQGSGPVLLVGTYRPDALHRRHPTAEMLPRLERRHAVTHLHLDRLSVRRSARSSPRSTGANRRTASSRHCTPAPAATRSSSRSCSPRPARTIPTSCIRQELPWSLAELVRTQLDDLTTEQRGVLETAAVLGVTRVGFDVLAAVSGLLRGRAHPDPARTSSRAGCSIEAEADAFSFRHALAREAIESDLLGRERRRLHQAALDALREMGSDDFAAIAHHAYGAGQFDDMVEAAARGRAGDRCTPVRPTRRCSSPSSGSPRSPTIRSCSTSRAGPPGCAVCSPTPAASRGRSLERARRVGRPRSGVGRAAAHLPAGPRPRAMPPATTTDNAALAELVERLDEGPEQARAFAVLAEMAMLRDDLARRDEVGRPRGRAGRPARICPRCGPTRRSSAARRS